MEYAKNAWPPWAPVQRAAGPAGEMNFGVTLIWINAVAPSMALIGAMSFDHVAALGALCGPGGLGVAAALFGVGLLGGFVHCAPMCGPFVMMQLAAEGSAAPGLRRLSAAAMPGYHLGRMTTYVALGAAAGGLGASVVEWTQFRALLAIMLMAAALCFLLQAMKRLIPLTAPSILRRASERWGGLIATMALPLLRRPSRARFGAYPLGLVLGLLPCGFLYAALITAAAAGSSAAGAAAMAAFTLGTVPGLAAVGILGSLALRRCRGLAEALAAPIFLLNAATLAILATRMSA